MLANLNYNLFSNMLLNSLYARNLSVDEQFFVGVTDYTTLDFCGAAKAATGLTSCEEISISASAQDTDNTYELFEPQTLTESAPLILDLVDNPDMYGLWDITFSWEEDGGDGSSSGGEIYADDSVDGGGDIDSRLRRLSEEMTKVYEFSYPCR